MARSKYRHDTIVKFKLTNGTTDSGLIVGVVSRKEGHSYVVQNETTQAELEVRENDVITAYRVIAPSVTRAKRVQKKAPAKAKAATRPAVAQERDRDQEAA